jgi:hypothetical protein
MSWEKYDDSGTRWTWTADEERHLLMQDDATAQLREYHEPPAPSAVTVHTYTTASADQYDEREPLNRAEHIRTYEVAANHAPWMRAADDREVFEWLAAEGYAT